MTDWFGGLTFEQQAYYSIALIATAMVVLQTLMLFVGGSENSARDAHQVEHETIDGLDREGRVANDRARLCCDSRVLEKSAAKGGPCTPSRSSHACTIRSGSSASGMVGR